MARIQFLGLDAAERGVLASALEEFAECSEEAADDKRAEAAESADAGLLAEADYLEVQAVVARHLVEQLA